MSIMRILAIVLLIAGVVLLILGVYNLISFNTSAGGRFANRVAGVFGSRTKPVQNAMIQIVIGAACAAVGFVLYRKR